MYHRKESSSFKVERQGEGQGDYSVLELHTNLDLNPSALVSPILSASRQFPSLLNDSAYLQFSSSISHVEDLGNVSIASNPLASSSLLEPDVDMDLDSMNESELKLSLSQYMTENSSLKSEIQEKNRQISKVKTQVKVLLDLETSENLNLSSVFAKESKNDTQGIIDTSTSDDEDADTDSSISTTGNEIVEQDDLTEEVIRMLPEGTFVFIREITSRVVEMDQTVIRERMMDGLHITNQIALGGVTSWAAAYLLKNFGKTALTALGGGALILAFANRKGYVEVNWNEIYEELQKQSEQRLNSSNGEMEDQPDWTAEKIRNAKAWINNHSITVGGFVCGFLYKLF